MYQYIMSIIQFVKILACVAISVAIRVGVLKQRNWFGDQRALLQGIIDALNAVLFHLQEKARRHLRLRCARIEESRCGMCEELPGHQVIGLHSRCHIAAVDATGCAHDEVLWPFHTLSVHTEKIRLLQGFETKVVVPKVTWRQRVTRCHFSSESQHVAKKNTTMFGIQHEPARTNSTSLLQEETNELQIRQSSRMIVLGPFSSRDQDGLLVLRPTTKGGDKLDVAKFAEPR